MIRPRKSRLFVRMFRAYNRRLLARTFRRIHLDGDPSVLAPEGGAPLLICLSHASWWDPLLALLLDERVPGLDSYGIMDARQLRRWGFFTRLGMIGVDRADLADARRLLEYAPRLLSEPNKALWITPQGRFASLAERPLAFQAGIGHIAARLPRFRAATVVFDYEFWDSSKPEAFVSVRPPTVHQGGALDRSAFVRSMERRMEDQIEALTALRIQRNSALFTPLLVGRSGAVPSAHDADSPQADGRGAAREARLSEAGPGHIVSGRRA